MDYKSIEKRLLAASSLLDEKTITSAKFESVCQLIKGIHPKLDKKLSTCSKILIDVQKFQREEIIDLSVEALPEDTKEDKKRKKLLLLFLNSWKDLKHEVVRVQSEFEKNIKNGNSRTGKISSVGRILALAKGPLGIITIVAGVIVIINSVAVHVTIKNQGCSPITTTNYLPISLPGLSLPKDPILNGQQAVAKLPPLNFNIDGTSQGFISIQALGLHMNFNLPSQRTDFLFDGTSLLGRQTDIQLSIQSSHELVIQCF